MISSTSTNEQGEFELDYSMSDYGVGYVATEGDNSFFVILSSDDIELEGKSLTLTNRIDIIRGSESQWLGQYASEHPRR